MSGTIPVPEGEDQTRMSNQEGIYRTLYDRLPIGLFRISELGLITRVNDGMVKILDVQDKSSLLNLPLRDIFMDPDDLDLALTRLQGAGIVENFDLRLRRSDQSSIWVRMNAREIEDKDTGGIYYEGALEDVSREKKTSEALRESDHFAKTIIDSVGEGVVVYDRQLRHVIWNLFMEQLTGITAAEAVGRPASGLFPQIQDDEEVNERLGRALSGEVVYEVDLPYYSTRTGRSGWYSAVHSPHRSSTGEIIGVVATIHETTARRQADQERDRLLELEREQRLRAEAIGRISMALNAVLDLPLLLDLICRECSELFRVDATLVWLVDEREEGTDIIKNIAGYGWEHERFAGMQIKLDDMNNLATRVIREQAPLWLNEVTENTRTGLSGVFKVRSILAVPLYQGNDVFGVLQIIDNHRINRFGETETEIAMQVASHAAIAVKNAQLYDALNESHRDLEDAYVSTLEGWARALELRDANTEGHSNRVTELTLKLARAVGVADDELEHIRRGSLLHDIGKMGVPDAILGKPGPLTKEEWHIMKQHPVYAHSMLSPIGHLKQAMDIPYYHHERWNGSGYPDGLAGEKIPLAARIFALVDVFDALTSDRPYRKAWSREDTIDYIQRESGVLFDPKLVEIFLTII